VFGLGSDRLVSELGLLEVLARGVVGCALGREVGINTERVSLVSRETQALSLYNTFSMFVEELTLSLIHI
jgi:hypothetical protein